MNYWLCVVSPENFNVVDKELVWGVEDRHVKKIEEVQKGDLLIMYVMGEKKIKGIYEAISKPYRDDKEIFTGGIYPNRIKLKKIKRGELDIKKVKDQMELFKGKGKFWALILRGKAMITISEKDFKTIEKQL